MQAVSNICCTYQLMIPFKRSSIITSDILCLAVIVTSTSNEEKRYGGAASPKQINEAMMLDPPSTSHAQQCGIEDIARGTVDPQSTKMAR